MMETLQTTTPLVPGGPAWLTLPFALIGVGVLIALLILFIGARVAGSRRRAERALREQDAAYYVEEEIPTARRITPRPPEFADPVAAAPAYAPETEPLPEPSHFEGAPARQPEPWPLAEAPNPDAAPLDAAPAGLTAATEDPPVAAEGEKAFEPDFSDEPIAAPAPEEASPAALATDLAEPESGAAPEPARSDFAADEAPERAEAPEVSAWEAVAPDPAVETAPEPAPAPSVPDDLTRMKGVGPRLAERLNTVGVTSFAQIAALSTEEAAALDSKLGDFQGRLERDRWIDQAGYLASDDIAAFEETFGKL